MSHILRSSKTQTPNHITPAATNYDRLCTDRVDNGMYVLMYISSHLMPELCWEPVRFLLSMCDSSLCTAAALNTSSCHANGLDIHIGLYVWLYRSLRGVLCHGHSSWQVCLQLAHAYMTMLALMIRHILWLAIIKIRDSPLQICLHA